MTRDAYQGAHECSNCGAADVARARHQMWLLGWCAVIVLLVVPWSSMQAHPDWMKIRWVPFLSPPIVPRDIVLNVLLYMPLGFWHARQDRAWPRTLLFALAVATLTEFSQVFGHGRFPSMTDILCNVCGALLARRCVPRERVSS